MSKRLNQARGGHVAVAHHFMPEELPRDPASDPLPVEPVLPGSSGLAPNLAAGLATLFTLVGGIVFLLIEKRSAFVRFWAMQSVFFGVAWIVFGFVEAIVHVILSSIFWPLAAIWHLVCMVVQLAFLILWVVAIVKSFQGKEWEIPVLGRMARQQLARTPLT